MKIKSRLIAFLLVLFMSVPFITFAQADPPDDPIDTPIDTWLVVLLFAGAIYGYKKFRKHTKLSS